MALTFHFIGWFILITHTFGLLLALWGVKLPAKEQEGDGTFTVILHSLYILFVAWALTKG